MKEELDLGIAAGNLVRDLARHRLYVTLGDARKALGSVYRLVPVHAHAGHELTTLLFERIGSTLRVYECSLPDTLVLRLRDTLFDTLP